MKKTSAGLLMYKIKDNNLLVFLVHPGGPFWKNKDEHAWSIPKGEADNNAKNEKELFEAARREFKEETGIEINKDIEFIYLQNIKQKSGKVVHCWAFEGDWSGLLMCQSFAEIEWPFKSGKFIKIPEVDKAGFFSIEQAKRKLNPAQIELIDRLQEYLKNK